MSAAATAPRESGRQIRLLVFSTLFPNAVQPSHGVFVENRLRHLLSDGGVSAQVVAPVPWFPSAVHRFGRYAAYARVAAEETRFGIAVRHPRYVVIPHVGMTLAPFLLYAAARGAVARLLAEGHRFDLIDAHYFYPDGIAAIMLGRRFGLPVTITARGTDLNLIPRYAVPRRMIQWAAGRADGLITVCQALKDTLVELGVAGDRITVLRNGVDLALFRPGDRVAQRQRYGLDGPTLISVGHLIRRKGHHLPIQALAMLPGVRLLVVGDGPERAALEATAASAGVADRVRFLGRRPHDELPDLYGAADALVLASSREGWANVLLEAMACGTPVVASNVWGTPEVVATPEAGRLMAARTPEALADAARALLADPPARAATRSYAEGFSWDATSRGQKTLFERILAERSAAQPR